MYVKTAVILSTIVASYYGAFYACTSLQSCIAFAVLLGIGMGEVGVSIMHDANHGAYCTVPWITWLMSTTLDMVGASSFMWRQQHVAGHHVHTNVEDKDPDIRVSDPDVRRVTPKQPWQPYHVRGSINTCHSLPMCAQQRQQHLYLAALYGLLSIKSVLVDDFSALAKGCIGPVRLSTMVWHESLIFWGGKLLFAVWFVVLPLLYSPHGVGRLLVLWLTCQLCIGWMLAFMFQVRWYQLLHFTESCTNAGCARDGRRRVSQARPEQGQCGHGVGRSAGGHVCRLCTWLMVLDAFQRRPQLPGRPPPVSRHQPRPLPRAGAHRAGNVPRVWCAIHSVPHILGSAGCAL